MERLFSPWRLRYIASARRERGCVFCRVRRSRRDRAHLVLHRGRHHFILLNKYPYNNGHLMIVPDRHLGSFVGADPAALGEMMALAVHAAAALQRAYAPTGLNLGMNLGRSAGAGITGHYHLHIVPRWDGDTNFMTTVHGTRVIPESLAASWRRLRPLLSGETPAAGRARRTSRRGRGRAGRRR